MNSVQESKPPWMSIWAQTGHRDLCSISTDPPWATLHALAAIEEAIEAQWTSGEPNQASNPRSGLINWKQPKDHHEQPEKPTDQTRWTFGKPNQAKSQIGTKKSRTNKRPPWTTRKTNVLDPLLLNLDDLHGPPEAKSHRKVQHKPNSKFHNQSPCLIWKTHNTKRTAKQP